MAASDLEAEAFKKLYPDAYFARFLAGGVRPDGRALASARDASISLNVVGSADSSALVKLGHTSVLTGIKLEVMITKEGRQGQGELAIAVEEALFSSPDLRPGRQSAAAQVLAHQVQSALMTAKAVDLRQLSIGAGKVAWKVFLDIYILDNDGSLYDAGLLASVAALASLRLPCVAVDDSGNVIPTNEPLPPPLIQNGGVASGGFLALAVMPLALTCGLYEEYVIVDPTTEEESLLGATISVTVDGKGDILGVLKPGGKAAASLERLQECIRAASQRHATLSAILQQALLAAA